jgi:acyl-CoA synthetase (AMP-forming)/AMP-acid ligase II
LNITTYLLEGSKAINKPALYFGDTTISFPELYRNSQTVAKSLADLGHRLGDKILLISNNSFFWVATYFGTMGAGMVSVPLHHTVSRDTLDFVIDTCNIRTCFVQKRYLKHIRDYDLKTVITDEPGIGGTQFFGDLTQGTVEFSKISDENAKKTLAVMLFTSGSTGKPKGVMLSHHNIKWNTDSIVEYLSLTGKDRMMVVLPFSYCYGASWLHTLIRVGGQCVLNNRFMFPGKVLEEINEKACTGFAGVPSTFQILLRRSPLKRMRFPTLRFVAQAGGKLTNPFIEELMETLPDTEICIMYGQTEATARLSYLPPDLLNAKLGSCGKGIPRTKLEVLNSTGKSVKSGEIGEVVASGGNIMMGYWNDPEGTAKVLKNGKLHTGDLAVVDDDGFIYIVDRQKEIIKSGGHRISPREVEATIARIPEVVEVGVIGVMDDLLGEAVKAYVVLRAEAAEEITARDIISHCRGHLASHKVPKHIVFLSTLPKNESEKVMMAELRELHKRGDVIK